MLTNRLALSLVLLPLAELEPVEEAVIEEAASPPWRATGTPDQQREDACAWLAARAVRPHPFEKRRAFRVLPVSHGVTVADCNWELDVVTLSATELRRWHWVHHGRGVAVGQERLNGLFGFLQSTVWPFWVNDWCPRRIQIEPDLPAPVRAAVLRYQQFEAAKGALLRKSIADWLRRHPRSQALYQAVEDEDLAGLRRCYRVWNRYGTGVKRVHLREYIDFIEAGDGTMVRQRKHHLRYCLLSHIVARRIQDGEVVRHSAAYEAAEQQGSVELTQLMEVATRWYAGRFRDFCLRDDVRAMERDLFSGACLSGSRSYEDLVEELAATRTPLSQQQQLRS